MNFLNREGLEKAGIFFDELFYSIKENKNEKKNW